MTNTTRIIKKHVLKSRDPVKGMLKPETSKSSVKTVSIFRGYNHCMTKDTSNTYYFICFVLLARQVSVSKSENLTKRLTFDMVS